MYIYIYMYVYIYMYTYIYTNIMRKIHCFKENGEKKWWLSRSYVSRHQVTRTIPLQFQQCQKIAPADAPRVGWCCPWIADLEVLPVQSDASKNRDVKIWHLKEVPKILVFHRGKFVSSDCEVWSQSGAPTWKGWFPPHSRGLHLALRRQQPPPAFQGHSRHPRSCGQGPGRPPGRVLTYDMGGEYLKSWQHQDELCRNSDFCRLGPIWKWTIHSSTPSVEDFNAIPSTAPSKSWGTI